MLTVFYSVFICQNGSTQRPSNEKSCLSGVQNAGLSCGSYRFQIVPGSAVQGFGICEYREAELFFQELVVNKNIAIQ